MKRETKEAIETCLVVTFATSTVGVSIIGFIGFMLMGLHGYLN